MLSLVVIGCSKNEMQGMEESPLSIGQNNAITMVTKGENNKNSISLTDVVGSVNLTTGIHGSLHRKYTKCMRRFSICGVGVGYSDFETHELGLIPTDNGGGSMSIIIYFMDEPSVIEPFFIGADDAPFTFGTQVSEFLGYSSITTIPADYNYHNETFEVVDVNGLTRTAFGKAIIECSYTL